MKYRMYYNHKIPPPPLPTLEYPMMQAALHL